MTEEGWLETFRCLKGRGLEGVELMVSDAHEGLTEALHQHAGAAHPGDEERREKFVRIFPSDESAWRLLGASPAETHEDWRTGRRYFRMGEDFRWKQQQQAAEGGDSTGSLTSDPSIRRETRFHSTGSVPVLYPPRTSFIYEDENISSGSPGQTTE